MLRTVEKIWVAVKDGKFVVDSFETDRNGEMTQGITWASEEDALREIEYMQDSNSGDVRDFWSQVTVIGVYNERRNI